MTVETALTIVPPPFALPAGCASRSVRLNDEASDLGGLGVDLPSELADAVVRRRAHFRAGRWCAQAALAEAGCTVVSGLPRLPSGAPQWPAGFAGSITHTGSFVWAVAAATSAVEGIGVDAEAVMPDARRAAVSAMILQAAERDAPGALDPCVWATLVFSLKESLFKCLYPLAGERFYYQDAAVTLREPPDTGPGEALLTLSRALGPNYPAGREFTGRFVVRGAMVTTGVWLPSALSTR